MHPKSTCDSPALVGRVRPCLVAASSNLTILPSGNINASSNTKPEEADQNCLRWPEPSRSGATWPHMFWIGPDQGGEQAWTASSRPKKGTVDDVVARLERMPISSWHLRARFIVGVATFFDGFDVLAIAYVLPVIGPYWHLSPPQIGLLLSASFLGQLLAALFFGWFAERYGRMPAIIWSTLIYSVMSLARAFAWDFNSLLILRTLQGIGIGGEVPVAITYIAELSRAERRGRFLLLYELVFPIGLVAAVLVGALVVPYVGWQWLFVIGALPGTRGLLHVALVALNRRADQPRGPLCGEAERGRQHDRTGRGTLHRPTASRPARGQVTRARRVAFGFVWLRTSSISH